MEVHTIIHKDKSKTQWSTKLKKKFYITNSQSQLSNQSKIIQLYHQKWKPNLSVMWIMVLHTG